MISLLIAFAVLIVGYLVYSRVADRIFASDDRQTPAIAHNDGVFRVVVSKDQILLCMRSRNASIGLAHE